jgi:hypothetical protein
MITRLITAAAVALFFSPAMPLFAAEHPKKEAEHPEHPEKGPQGEATTADISAGIKKHIESETKTSGDGKFHVQHEGEDLALELIKVHDERLSSLGGGKYFACVDMKAADGITYDIDFFLSGKPGEMNVTDTSVHKVQGKALYNWKEEDGVWKKVPTS